MKLTKRTIGYAVAGLFALIGFFMVFAVDGWKEFYFGMSVSVGGFSASTKGAVGAFVGFVLLLVGALIAFYAAYAAAASKLDDKKAKIISIILILLFLIGAILVFLSNTLYCSANDIPAELAKETELDATQIVGGVFGIIGVLGAGVSGFLFKE